METDILDRQLPTTDYYPTGWLRKLDLASMVLAPISISLPFFLFIILLLYHATGSNTIKYYEAAFASFLAGIGMLIVFVPYFRDAIKSYVTYQATKDNFNIFRLFSYAIIFLGLVGDFIFYFIFFESYF